MYMRIAAARHATQFGIVLVGEQAATVVHKTLPSTVFKTMSQDLAETVVGELFMRRQSICVRRIIDSGHKVRVRIARVGGYFLTLVADSMHIMTVIV